MVFQKSAFYPGVKKNETAAGTQAHFFCQGHIPNSLNIDARELIDPELKTFLPRRDLEVLFLKEGVSKTDRIIPYCGGGIASALCAFTLTMLDYEHVALYDGSLEEWRRDPQLPMEISDN